MFRRSQEPRVDIFFAASTWVGVPEIREPHKCTELVWADPGQLPDDTLDFLGQAWADARDGRRWGSGIRPNCLSSVNALGTSA